MTWGQLRMALATGCDGLSRLNGVEISKAGSKVTKQYAWFVHMNATSAFSIGLDGEQLGHDWVTQVINMDPQKADHGLPRSLVAPRP